MRSIRSGGGSLEGFSTSRVSPAIVIDLEADAGRGDDEREIELPLEPLLHDLEVQHAEEPAAEPVTERERRLRLEVERGVVQAQLLERVAQPFVVGVLDRVEPREHHRLGVAVAGRRARRSGGATSVMVSPILASATRLIEAVR